MVYVSTEGLATLLMVNGILIDPCGSLCNKLPPSQSGVSVVNCSTRCSKTKMRERKVADGVDLEVLLACNADSGQQLREDTTGSVSTMISSEF